MIYEKWEPIETAPKNGDTILLNYLNKWVCSASWSDGEHSGWIDPISYDSVFEDLEPSGWLPRDALP